MLFYTIGVEYQTVILNIIQYFVVLDVVLDDTERYLVLFSIFSA